jgi:hypothetical protein
MVEIKTRKNRVNVRFFSAMEPGRSENPSESEKVISPFAHSDVAISPQKGNGGGLFWIIGLSLFLVVAGAISGIFVMRYVNDPYRTLGPFPVSKYFDGYQALAGSKFKAEFRVEADLGWKDGTGRLMLFSTTDDPRPIAVLIPATVANGIYFTKGQTYVAEIEVKEGGLIYANSCQKD